MEKIIDFSVYKEQSFKIFMAAIEFYNNFSARDNKKLIFDDTEAAFERIHKIALEVGELEILVLDEPLKNKYPLTPILVAYVRAMLIDRLGFPSEAADGSYRPDTETFIFSFIYLYVKAANPEKTMLLHPVLLEDAYKPIVDGLFFFRYTWHNFNRMCVNLVVENLFLYNCRYAAIMFKELYNRDAIRCFWEYFGNDASFGVIMLDGDHFKDVNDKCGHVTGDEVLGIYKDSILSAIDSMASLKGKIYPARWGGEEFVVAVNNSDPNMLMEVSKKIKSELASSPAWDAFTQKYSRISFPRTASQGIALGKKSQIKSLDTLIDSADKQLYLAKNDGRNCIFYNDSRVG